jgi:hypothetical protein
MDNIFVENIIASGLGDFPVENMVIASFGCGVSAVRRRGHKQSC